MACDKLERLQSYWECRRSGRRLPGRRDIDPTDLPRHLSTMMLIDGLGSGERYRFRLVGTLLSQVMRRDPTGRHLDEVLEPAELDGLDDLFGHAARHRVPVRRRGLLVWTAGWQVGVEWLILPLATDGSIVDIILAWVEIPALPVRLPPGRPQLMVSWPPPAAPRRPADAGGPLAPRRWLSLAEALNAAPAAP
ncbi:MAG: PAS domain-containing protein [Rhodospirillaceae bacterium]